MKNKALALYSGGLDSTLAVLLTLKQGFDVVAINFTTPFGCSPEDKSSCSRADNNVANQFGFTLKYFPLGDKFIKIVKNPKYGFGRNMNPCIDCRILMLNEARQLMAPVGAQFIITGEVIGQRPMSQYKKMLKIIDAEANVEGKVVRPLCGRLLDKTEPEEKGLIDRNNLLDISGRRRNAQYDLARRMGFFKIPQPAGGCLLTDPVYSRRLRDLLKHKPGADMWDIALLKTGRQFRLSDKCKLIVGRREAENIEIEKIYPSSGALSYLIVPADDNIPGPTSLLFFKEQKSEDLLKTALSICARYSDGFSTGSVKLKVMGQSFEEIVSIAPASDALIEKHRI